MLYVKTKLQQSSISDIGLFADQHISKGAIIWAFTPDIDLIINKEVILQLTKQQQIDFFKYAYRFNKDYIYCSDNSKFMNHSNAANTHHSPTICIASQDIKPNEEITCNYSDFIPDYIPFEITIYSHEEWCELQLKNIFERQT